MFRTARRPVGTFALLLILAPSFTGCMTTRQTYFTSNNTVALDRVTGITTRSGREIRFRLPGMSIVNDTMYAVGPDAEMILPADSIAQVWDRHTSTARTVGLVAGLALVGVAIVGAISFDNNFHPFGGGSWY
jgi:hypothetical protein